MEQESISMEVVNPQAAGIDVGSRSHLVAVGQTEQDVREFGVYNQDLFNMADWLEERNIKTIAMESTGTYWQNLYAVLISKGFHVILCNGKFTKNIKGKKSDVMDCQWIQKLHTLGLLTGSFLPDGQTEELRTYCRHRANLLHSAASISKKMQKYPCSVAFAMRLKSYFAFTMRLLHLLIFQDTCIVLCAANNYSSGEKAIPATTGLL